MKTLCERLGWLALLTALSTAANATGLVWGEGNWGETDWGQARQAVAPPDGPVPKAKKSHSFSGEETDAGFAAGAYADNGAPVYGNRFVAGDYITMIGEVYPDSADIGKKGDIVVVMLSIIDGTVSINFLNADGNFETWDQSIAGLGPAKAVDPLEEVHTLTLFEGTLQPGVHRLALGYIAEGGPLIYTGKAVNIVVSE